MFSAKVARSHRRLFLHPYPGLQQTDDNVDEFDFTLCREAPALSLPGSTSRPRPTYEDSNDDDNEGEVTRLSEYIRNLGKSTRRRSLGQRRPRQPSRRPMPEPISSSGGAPHNTLPLVEEGASLPHGTPPGVVGKRKRSLDGSPPPPRSNRARYDGSETIAPAPASTNLFPLHSNISFPAAPSPVEPPTPAPAPDNPLRPSNRPFELPMQRENSRRAEEWRLWARNTGRWDEAEQAIRAADLNLARMKFSLPLELQRPASEQPKPEHLEQTNTMPCREVNDPYGLPGFFDGWHPLEAPLQPARGPNGSVCTEESMLFTWRTVYWNEYQTG